MAPRILESVPAEFAELARSSRERTWESECDHWFEGQVDNLEAAWDLQYAASGWIGARTLDTGYLSPCAKIWFWRLEDSISIEWDNRGKEFEGVQAWSAIRGSYSLSVDIFVNELRSFHARFMDAMRARIEAVCKSWPWPWPQIQIDAHSLQFAQDQQSSWIERLVDHVEPTDWQGARAAMQRIEQTPLV